MLKLAVPPIKKYHEKYRGYWLHVRHNKIGACIEAAALLDNLGSITGNDDLHKLHMTWAQVRKETLPSPPLGELQVVVLAATAWVLALTDSRKDDIEYWTAKGKPPNDGKRRTAQAKKLVDWLFPASAPKHIFDPTWPEWDAILICSGSKYLIMQTTC